LQPPPSPTPPSPPAEGKSLLNAGPARYVSGVAPADEVERLKVAHEQDWSQWEKDWLGTEADTLRRVPHRSPSAGYSKPRHFSRAVDAAPVVIPLVTPAELGKRYDTKGRRARWAAMVAGSQFYPASFTLMHLPFYTTLTSYIHSIDPAPLSTQLHGISFHPIPTINSSNILFRALPLPVPWCTGFGSQDRRAEVPTDGAAGSPYPR